MRKTLAATIMCAVLIVLGTGWVLGVATTLSTFQPEAAGQKIQREGVALVDRCTPTPPVSVSGFGTWWECEGRVRWEGAESVPLHTRDSQLTPQHRGTPVPVVERLVSTCRGCPPDTPRVYRADFQPSNVKPIAIGAATGAAALFLLAIAAGTLVRLGLLRAPDKSAK